MKSVTKKSLVGIIWMLIFSFSSVAADGIVRYVTIDGFPSIQILFIRCVIGVIILFPIVFKNKDLSISKKLFKLYIYRGFFAFLGVASWFYLLKYADFTALIAIGFTSPLFACLFAICFLKEKYSNIKIAALLIGFSGAMIVIKPFSIHFNIYLLCAVLSSFFWAISLIFAKKLANNQSAIAIAFFFALILIPLSFALALPFWQAPTITQLYYILLFSIISTIAQISLAQAFRYSDITTLMPFEYSALIFAALFSYIVFGELASFNTLAGGMVILASGYIIIRSQRKKKRAEQELDMIP